MSEAAENNMGSCPKGVIGQPPPLSIKLPKLSDLPKQCKPWSDDQLPVDILLLTVEDCEFLACYAYMRKPFKSYHKELGYVHFGNVGEDEDEPLKIALMKCSEGSSGPGGSQTVVTNAVVQLRPKAIYSAGCCVGLDRGRTQLGDVVVSSKLTTEDFRTPVGRDIANLVKHLADGWEAPLQNPEAWKVHVHCDGEVLSGIDQGTFERYHGFYPKAIAVEKEGKGIFVAAHDLKIEWVIVKGVSCIADGSKAPDDSWKSFAGVMAASVVFNMLTDPIVFRQWPHYQVMSPNEERSTSNTPKRKLPSSLDSQSTKRSRLAESMCLEECQKQLRSIYNTMSKVKIVTWDESSAVHIDKIYTQLSWLKDDRKPSGVTKERLKDYTEIFSSRKNNPKLNRILVYGRPGIGKTVFTQKATFDWSQERKEMFATFELVLLVKLRDVCDLKDVPALLRASELLASDGVISTDDLYHYILHNQEKVLLILDGYDEYSAGKKSPVRDIWEKKQLRDCCVIVTTRQRKADDLRSRSDAQFEINGFDSRDQVKRFASNFLKDEKDVTEFQEYLEQQNLKNMAEIPLLLLMLCLLWMEKDRTGLPTRRADVYTQFIQTLFNHMCEKDADTEEFRTVGDYTQELCKLGKLAFDALLRDSLYLSVSEVPGDVLIKELVDVGLFQISKLSSLNPDKGIFFIHKSVEEFLAAWYLKNERLFAKDGNATALSKIDSVEKIFKMAEVLKFASEMSEEAACSIVSQMGLVAGEEGLIEFSFKETPSEKDLTVEQRNFLTLIACVFFHCSAGMRRDLFSKFLCSSGGVLLISSDQLHIIAKEHLANSSAPPNFVFFSDSKHPVQGICDLISLVEDLNGVVVSCSGEMKASDFLKKYQFRHLQSFFIKKDGNMHLYFSQIGVQTVRRCRFPTKMLKDLIASKDSSQDKKIVADQSSEKDNRSDLGLADNAARFSCPTHHCLSLAREIKVEDADRPVMETLAEVLPLMNSPGVIWIEGKEGEAHDAQLTETLVSRIHFSDRLEMLTLSGINLTAKSAANIATSLYKVPNLLLLDLSSNPLGEGASVRNLNLSCVPRLKYLDLDDVKMTKEQANDLTTAVRQSKISNLLSLYHDRKGNPKPEHEWPTEEYWMQHPHLVPKPSDETEDE